jgi:hypothetical protein
VPNMTRTTVAGTDGAVASCLMLMVYTCEQVRLLS